MPKWIDEKINDEVVGSSYQAGMFDMYIMTFKSDRGHWNLWCEPFFKNHRLAPTNLKEAQTQALALVQVKLEEVISDILSVTN